MGTIYILGAVQSLFFALLIIFRKSNKRADQFLMAFFLLMTLFLLFAYSNTIEFYKTYPLIMPIIVLVPLLYGPILYFYVYELNAMHNRKRNYGFHLIPIVLYYLIMFPIFLKENHTDLIGFFNARFIDLPLYINLGVIIQYLSAPTYFVFILIMLSKHKKNIKNSFSNDENVNLNWLNYLVLGAILLWLFETAMIVYWNYFGQSAPLDFSKLVKSSYVIFIFLMGFYGLRQGDIFTQADIEKFKPNPNNLNPCEPKQTTKVKNGNKNADLNAEICKTKLLKYLTEEKPYLNSHLKLLDMALYLKIPPHVLSNVINENLNKNYFDLINTYRVEEAKKLLLKSDVESYTIISIAYDCGFNSKSSFNRIFKNQTGLTPSMYRKQNFVSV